MCRSKKTKENDSPRLDSPKVKPIVFVNNPIADEKHDAIGFGAYVNTAKAAIDEGATTIGLIAGYGTGKSSLTNLLGVSLEKDGHPKPIYVNLWDCFNNCEKKKSEEKVSDLTKSFLFQLANGHSSSLANYANKALNNNYGKIHFAISSKKKFYWLAILALAMLTLYAIMSATGTGITHVLSEWAINILPYIKVLKPLALCGAVVLLFFALQNTSIAFSHWKMTHKYETEISDIFDIYHVIADALIITGKKQLVFIDDLDRIDDKETVTSFIKELYRFQDSIPESKKGIVFVVSVKPEKELTSKQKDSGVPAPVQDDLAYSANLYSKVFDTMLYLRPIHFDDYDAILLSLMDNEPEKKKALGKLIGENIDNTIPESFKWIKKGKNLTLRDLKERLNQSITVYVSLIEKSYLGNSSAKFIACTAVTYLENQYPEDYYRLIKDESDFAKFMSVGYRFVDETKDGDNIEQLVTFFTEVFKESKYTPEFVNDLCEMILEQEFNDDYRMYFYTYPKGSHIKTTEEHYICNCILLPNQNQTYRDLDNAVQRAYAKGRNETIYGILAGRSVFPRVILENDVLFEEAVSISEEKAFATFNKYIISADVDGNVFTQTYWKRIRTLSGNERINFIKKCVAKIAEIMDEEKVVRKRMHMILGFEEEIFDIIDVFMHTDTPQITEEELLTVSALERAVQLISVNKIEKEQQVYIFNIINSQQLKDNEKAWSHVLSVVKKLVEMVDDEDIAQDLLDFLKVNRYCDDELFEIVCSGRIKDSDIAEYVNLFNPEMLSDKYLQLIDDVGFEAFLDRKIVAWLITKNRFYTPILYSVANETYDDMADAIDYRDKVKEACQRINQIKPETVIAFRQYCVIEKGKYLLSKLYMDDFPLITKEEYIRFESATDAFEHINRAIIDNAKIPDIIDVINSREYTPAEAINLFDYLFVDNDDHSCITENSIVAAIVDSVDYDRLHIKEMSYEQRNSWYKTFNEKYVVDNAREALLFIERIGCLIPDVESVVVGGDNGLLEEYQDIISQFNELSPVTIQWLKNNYIHVALSDECCKQLYHEGDLTNYLIASVLRKKDLIMEPEIDFEYYQDIYLNVEEVFSFMSQHWDFLEQFQQKGDLEELSLEEIIPIFKVPQYARFFKFVFSEKWDKVVKKRYLSELREFKREEDSLAFQQLICKEENIPLVDSLELKESISRCLWDSKPWHKGLFTRAWNNYWGDKLKIPTMV